MNEDSFKVAIIAGEESADLLGADLVDSLAAITDKPIKLVGVGGHSLQERGLQSIFDANDIALMGLSDVLANIPKLYKHIRTLVNYLNRENPDFLLIIDSPDFTHRVARALKKIKPSLPIVKYVAPSVWAWRPQRARKMVPYIDLVLAILPFEEKVMAQLGGPKTKYVGHKLLTEPELISVRDLRQTFEQNRKVDTPTLLILPGSRFYEVKRLMPIFGEAVERLAKVNPNINVLLPTLPRIELAVRTLARAWSHPPKIVIGDSAKWEAFSKADVALAASGTVSLELALCNIPTILSYKADIFARLFIQPHITVWSAALPNIIAGEPIVPEFFNDFVRPEMLMKQLQYLIKDGPARQAQLKGFLTVRERMVTQGSAGEIAAREIIGLLNEYLDKN